jgi:hypothetical protein
MSGFSLIDSEFVNGTPKNSESELGTSTKWDPGNFSIDKIFPSNGIPQEKSWSLL